LRWRLKLYRDEQFLIEPKAMPAEYHCLWAARLYCYNDHQAVCSYQFRRVKMLIHRVSVFVEFGFISSRLILPKMCRRL